MSGKIIRIARGIYCKPKVDTEFGFGILYPSVDEVAQAIAQRDKCRIVPTGDAALNKLGLSTQVPMNAAYYTDGTPRRAMSVASSLTASDSYYPRNPRSRFMKTWNRFQVGSVPSY